MNKIPTDWEITEEEKELLEKYIIIRFQKVDKILKIFSLKVDETNGE